MNKLFLKIFISVSGFILLYSCDAYDVQHKLYDVESYIMERPDSALAVLDSMDRSCLTSDRLSAHHALLHAMALDKNFIDVTDDSIASVAVEYFSKRGPEKYKARALYYLGLSYYYAQDYDKAILEFTKAEKVAEMCDSLYWGMIKSLQSNTYSKTYNGKEALSNLEQAYDIFSNLSLDYYVNASALGLAKLYFNNNNRFKADSLLSKLIMSKDIDSRVRFSAIQSKAYLNVSDSNYDYDEAILLYDILLKECTSCMSYRDYWAYAYALINSGRQGESQDIVAQLSQVDTSTTAYYWQYLIEKSKGNYSEALTLLEKSVTANNIEVTDALEQSLALSQRDYYKSQSELSEYKADNRKLTIISISVVSVMILLLVLWSTSIYISRQREEKEYYLNYADEISRQLEAYKTGDYPELKRKYIELYKSKFEVIGNLYEQYTLFDGKKNAEHAIYERVSSIVEDFRNDYGNIRSLESVLNEDMDNIVANLRNEMPRFKEMDYSIFCFMLMGFDATTISHLLNTSINTIYIRKSRIKKSIEETNPEHKIQFLEVLN